MKLEKKKSESMDKIMNKLTITQMKAKEMRKTMSANQAPRSTHKVVFLYKYPISLTRCFVPNTLKSDTKAKQNYRGVGERKRKGKTEKEKEKSEKEKEKTEKEAILERMTSIEAVTPQPMAEYAGARRDCSIAHDHLIKVA